MLTKDQTTAIDTSSKERPSRGRSWIRWLVPKPFDLGSSLLYIGVLIPYLYSFATQTGYDPSLAWWQAMLMVAATAVLLAVDRIEYFLYGDETPTSAAVVLLLTRIVFIELLSWLDQFKYTPFLGAGLGCILRQTSVLQPRLVKRRNGTALSCPLHGRHRVGDYHRSRSGEGKGQSRSRRRTAR